MMHEAESILLISSCTMCGRMLVLFFLQLVQGKYLNVKQTAFDCAGIQCNYDDMYYNSNMHLQASPTDVTCSLLSWPIWKFHSALQS